MDPLAVLSFETRRFLSLSPDRERFRSPAELDAQLEAWRTAGVRIEPLGRSREGATIRAAVFGEDGPTLLAWGFPHPDEPLGAEALCYLGEGLLAGHVPELTSWRVVLVLCADPDGAARNEPWLGGDGTLRSFAASAWRPTHLGLEVEHGFPLDAPPYFVDDPAERGACRSRNECRSRCGPDGCRHASEPFAPLPESRALLAAIRRFRPQVIAAMHNALCSGDYSFLLHDETDVVYRTLTGLPAAVGSIRHLGEQVDRGRRLRRALPDLLRERSLDFFVRRLTRLPSYNPRFAYLQQHSAGAVVSALLPGAQFVTPECGLHRHSAFADTTPVEEVERCRVSVEQRRRRRYRLVRIFMNGAWVVAEQTRTDDPVAAPVEQFLPLSRGMLGVRALVERRRVLAAADRVWAQVSALDGLVEHPYADERARIRVPGAFVHDGAMKVFRLDRGYRRPPTVAEQASFAYSWPLGTVALLANFRSFLAVQDLSRPELAAAELAITALQETQMVALPEAFLHRAPVGPAIASQLGRVLALCAARTG